MLLLKCTISCMQGYFNVQYHWIFQLISILVETDKGIIWLPASSLSNTSMEIFKMMSYMSINSHSLLRVSLAGTYIIRMLFMCICGYRNGGILQSMINQSISQHGWEQQKQWVRRMSSHLESTSQVGIFKTLMGLIINQVLTEKLAFTHYSIY